MFNRFDISEKHVFDNTMGNIRVFLKLYFKDILIMCIHSTHWFYRLTFVSPSVAIYEAGTSLDWDGDTKICLLKFCQKRNDSFVEYPAILALGAMKRQTLLSSLHWICLITRSVHHIIILNVSANIFFAFGKMIRMMRSRTSFILSSQSWEIGSPPTGGAGRMK